MLSEWVRYYHQPGMFKEGDKIYAAYVARVMTYYMFSVKHLLIPVTPKAIIPSDTTLNLIYSILEHFPQLS